MTSPDTAGEIRLGYGATFRSLYERDGLVRLDGEFRRELEAADPALAERLRVARAAPSALQRKAESELLIALGPHLERFLGLLFGITEEIRGLRGAAQDLAPVFEAKRNFVQRRAARAWPPETAAAFDGAALAAQLARQIGAPVCEISFARAVLAWERAADAHAAELDTATRYAAWALHSQAGRAKHAEDVLFRVPHRVDPAALLPIEIVTANGVAAIERKGAARRREGFGLTDAGTDLRGALDEANYCIWCHNQGKDSCSTGLKDRKTGAFGKSPHGVTLAGCPLDEKISEMHTLKVEGAPVAALAVAIVDNPMLAGTGHRICNDCMKACIYQKQQPVDIPQAETRILKDVLDLPWGFEIYSLLTRWNPLDIRRPVPCSPTGYKVLTVGLGPAGFTLAHHLLNEGHTVAAIDGLKIEPLPSEISGVEPDGRRVPFAPIRDWHAILEPLDERLMAGFGGVAEYGITVRWDKNFLKLIRLLLERRAGFAMYGGVRFGGVFGIEQAFALGFDHIALCAGAGKPTVLDLPNGLAPGVRAASDFLMALQLTGAAKSNSIANLELRLPVVVVGGGLTAIDAATEARAYYPVQVEKFLTRYETLAAERGETAVRSAWKLEEAEIAEEYLAHARAIRAEREAAGRAGRAARISELVDAWGGVTVAYRRRLVDAPSYTLNHEEVSKALEEGIRFAENLTPNAIEVDASGRTAGLLCTHAQSAPVRLAARSILVAAGTHPNTVLGREDPSRLALAGRFFQAHDMDGATVEPARHPKPDEPHIFAWFAPDGRAVSFFGDLHPSFSGNVVKAMGGAKRGYPAISKCLRRREPEAKSPAALLAELDEGLRARIVKVVRLTPGIVEVVVRAPFAARAFRPGQFFRLQNYEAMAARIEGTVLAMEGLAMTGASATPESGLLSVIVLEMGGSSDLCAHLQPGEPVVLMGPTGTASEIQTGETVLLAGGGLGNAVLFSIGRAMRAAGCRVLYAAGYRRSADRFHAASIEAAADQIIWAAERAPKIRPGRAGDVSFLGNIIAGLVAYDDGRLGERKVRLAEIDRILVIGSDGMMAAFARALQPEGALAGRFKPDVKSVASVNSPMQCMMKELCAQCLQRQRDPATGEATIVFSCFAQDQPLDRVDFACLHDRLRQNAVQEKLTALWVDRALRRIGARR
jgi:NADPH-dependent glutamate synthase beta subunit-like oxidoreductase/NAD(P)H-flavin reductase